MLRHARPADAEPLARLYAAVRAEGRWLVTPPNAVSPPSEALFIGELIRADEVDEVFAILKSREVAVEGQTWNRRYREYMEKIKTGSVFEIAEVLRDLQRLKGDKELSFGERKMLDTARTLLIKEIAVATKSKEVKIEEKLDRIFAC